MSSSQVLISVALVEITIVAFADNDFNEIISEDFSGCNFDDLISFDLKGFSSYALLILKGMN